MKNIIIALVLMGLSLVTLGQDLPNAKFQTWVDMGAYENPEFWSSSNNPLLATLGVVTVSKSIDAFSGDYSAKLVTKEIPLTSYQVPGIITLAEINIITSPPSYSISGGLALQENVSKLTGVYKYNGIEGDSATVLIYNFKHESGSDFDTIGFGITYLNNTSSWTNFTVNMQNLNNHVPDTFNVIIMSSSSADFSSGAGSVLLVDSLVIETNTGIINLSNEQITVNVYPNPSTDFITFETNDSEKDRLISIYDIVGNLIGINDFNESSVRIPVNKLSSGLYTYQVTNRNRLLSRGSFVKK